MRSALELFSSTEYNAVSVHDVADRAGVTTGSLYHHFGGKPELYALVRSDVERRVADRVEAVLEDRGELGPALLAGFDWLARVGYQRIVGATPIDGVDSHLHRAVQDAVGVARAALALAAWRAALRGAVAEPDMAVDLRAALAAMLEVKPATPAA